MKPTEENMEKQEKLSGADIPFVFEYEDGDEIVSLFMGDNIGRETRRKKDKTEQS